MDFTVRSYELNDWEELISGVPLAENDEWVLIHELVTDFGPDGYRLLQKEQIADSFIDEEEELKQLVLQLKGYQPKKPENFAFAPLPKMLEWIEATYGLIELQDQEEEILMGRMSSIVANELRLLFVTADGYEDPSMLVPVFLSDIQTINFGSDYNRSLRLLWEYRKQQA